MSKPRFAFLLSLIVLCGIVPSPAKDKRDVGPPAPIPVQIATAKTAFVSYMGGDTVSPSGIYNKVYAALKQWNRYQLVASPREAELVFEISTEAGISYSPDAVILRIRDRETMVVLWTLSESLEVKEKLRYNQTDGPMVKDDSIVNLFSALQALEKRAHP